MAQVSQNLKDTRKILIFSRLVISLNMNSGSVYSMENIMQ